MVFQVRVRGRYSMQRLLFPSAISTFLDLQLQINDLFNVPPQDQVLSTTPLSKPSPVSGIPTQTLQQLGINNGDILYLGGEADRGKDTQKEKETKDTTDTKMAISSSQDNSKRGTAATSSSSSSSSAISSSSLLPSTSHLTPRCRHGPNGGCPHCMGSLQGGSTSSPSAAPLGKCNHGSSTTCIHCSSHVASGTKEPAIWLCNHPETAFCPKCLPPEDEFDTQSRRMKCDCDKAKGQECIKCVDKGPTIKVDKIPYSRYLDEKKAMCKFKHGKEMTCPFCMPDPFPSFKGKENCDKGHAPWPHGVCLSCAPPNANLRLQVYRHTDSISIEARVIQIFYTQASKRRNVPRGGILFGKYQEEPEETKNPGAIRALVWCIYDPPQEYNEKTGGLKFLKDEKETAVHEIAASMGLEPVGWIITTQPREGEKYGGKVLLSGAEVRQASRFQSRYGGPQGFSRFVTVLIEHQKGEVEPKAYQVADMAVGLETANAFVTPVDINMLSTRTPKKGEMVPTIVYKDRPLLPGVEFLPDELLVKVNIFSPRTPSSPFIHFDCPSNAGDTYLTSYFPEYKQASWDDKLSDFNILLALYRLIKKEVVVDIANSIVNKKPITQSTISELTAELHAHKILLSVRSK